MAYQRWWKTVRDQQGNVVNGASCAVYNGGTGTLATIYDANSSDSAPASISNPFTTTSTGVFGFMAADGEYDVQISGGSFAIQQYRVSLNAANISIVSDLAAPTGAGTVGYQAPYAGAVARTQAGKNADFVSIKDFGAVGDGIADDTAAIQAALNASLHISFCGVGNTYKVTGELTLASGHTLIFNGAAVTQTASQKAIFIITGTSGVRIDGGVFNGVGTDYVNSSSSRGCAILGANATSLDIRNCTFNNFSYSPVSSLTGGNGIRFINNIVNGPGAAILSPTVAAGSFVPTVLYRISSVGSTDFTLIGAASNMVGVEFTATGVGTGTGTAIKVGRNNSGITVGGNDIQISGNRITATGQGLIVASRSSNVVVSGNDIHDLVAEHGMYFDSGISCLNVTSNLVRNTPGTGIKVQNHDGIGTSKQVVISSNTLEGIGTDATLGGDGIIIYTSTGVQVCTDAIISGNNISNTNQEGISARDTTDMVIIGNNIHTVGRHGIFTNQLDYVNIVSNLIRMPNDCGIYEDGTSTNMFIKGNTILSPGQIGATGYTHGIIFSSNTAIYIEDNTVIGDSTKTQYCLYSAGANASGVSISGNVFTGAKEYAIRFAASTVGYLGSNRYSGYLGIAPNSLPQTQQSGNYDHAVYYSSTAPSTGTFLVGDVVKTRTPLGGTFAERRCTASGTYGTYSEGITCTTNGTSTVILSGSSAVLKPTDILRINGFTVQVLTISGTTMVVSGDITASGPGTAIAYWPPVFLNYGLIDSLAIASNGATTTYTYPANTTHVYITTSAASLATTLPATSADLDGLRITLVPSASVATATWVAGSGGATIVGGPSSLTANVPVRFIYEHGHTAWRPS